MKIAGPHNPWYCGPPLLTAVWINPCQASLKDGGLQNIGVKRQYLDVYEVKDLKKQQKSIRPWSNGSENRHREASGTLT